MIERRSSGEQNAPIRFATILRLRPNCVTAVSFQAAADAVPFLVVSTHEAEAIGTVRDQPWFGPSPNVSVIV